MDQEELAAQLKKPDGKLGTEVAAMMNKGNELINHWAIDALQLQPNDKVLEIGMGNGYFVKNILNMHPSIQYHGIDFSELMVDEAIRINDKYIASGRAGFSFGTASSLPFHSKTFTKFLSVNTLYFWGDAAAELSEIRRILQPGGIAVFAIRSKSAMDFMPFTEYGFRKYNEEALHQLMISNGFSIKGCLAKKEPGYMFEGTFIELENYVISCEANGE